MSYHDSSLTARITIIGSKESGKTSILRAFMSAGTTLDVWTTHNIKQFESSCMKDIMIDGQVITQHVLDSDGKNTATLAWSHGVIVVYAVNDRESLEEAEKYILQTKQLTMREADIVLVANKVDVKSRVVSMAEGQKLALKHNCNYIETSALHDHSKVKSIFYELGESVISKRGLKKSPTLVRRAFDSLVTQTEKYGNRLRKRSRAGSLF